jgi:DNA-binding transcriptional LysR family regulator
VFSREPSFQAALVLPDLRTLVAAVVAGAGATVVPDYLCRTELAAGRLIQHDPNVDLPVNEIELAWRHGGRQHPRNLIVRDLLLRIVER